MTALLKLFATWLVLSGMVVGVLGRADAAHAFMPASVTNGLDESPVDKAATQVGREQQLNADQMIMRALSG